MTISEFQKSLLKDKARIFTVIYGIDQNYYVIKEEGTYCVISFYRKPLSMVFFLEHTKYQLDWFLSHRSAYREVPLEEFLVKLIKARLK